MKWIFSFFLNCSLFANYVTCEIQGQLANQMFQTAAAIAFALDHGYEARFPGLKGAIKGELNIRYVFHRLNVSDLPANIPFSHTYEEAYNIFTPLKETGQNLCLHGYFPNEKYFAHHSNEIRDLFAPTEEMIFQIHEKYGHLLKNPTVAVHIRTFFPDDIDPNNGIGRTNWNYFLRAIEYFPEDYTILIFSDAPEWVKDHFPLIFHPHMHFIQGNPHYFDFYFISLCDHQVISPKSTYAWWAAWLNSNPDKIVIRADDGWAEDDAFPSSWIKMSVE